MNIPLQFRNAINFKMIELNAIAYAYTYLPSTSNKLNEALTGQYP